MFTLKERIKCWFIRTFITRNCWMPKGDTEFSWASDDDIPQWVKDTDKSKWTFEIPCDYYIEDELGGVHTDGVGYAPDGHFCGECTRESCKECWDNMNENIFLITVFEKCEPCDRWYFDLGATRSVGFRHTLEDAEEVVRNNVCDIWETCYHYACIEEISPMLYPNCESSHYYKYNKDIDGYEKIEVPELIKGHYFPIGGIG